MITAEDEAETFTGLSIKELEAMPDDRRRRELIGGAGLTRFG